jgi:hypothetical protein
MEHSKIVRLPLWGVLLCVGSISLIAPVFWLKICLAALGVIHFGSLFLFSEIIRRQNSIRGCYRGVAIAALLLSAGLLYASRYIDWILVLAALFCIAAIACITLIERKRNRELQITL